MSTKIYNAYEWKGTLPGLLKHLTRMRIGYIEEVKNRLVKIRNWDYDTPNNIPFRLLKLREQITHIEKIVEVGLNRFANIDASAVIYPWCETYAAYEPHDDADTRLFVQFFGVDLLQMDEIERYCVDFHYQNQADKSADVTDEEWKDRERIWDSIFENSSYPSLAGLTFEFYNKHILFNILCDLNIELGWGKEKFTLAEKEQDTDG